MRTLPQKASPLTRFLASSPLSRTADRRCTASGNLPPSDGSHAIVRNRWGGNVLETSTVHSDLLVASYTAHTVKAEPAAPTPRLASTPRAPGNHLRQNVASAPALPAPDAADEGLDALPAAIAPPATNAAEPPKKAKLLSPKPAASANEYGGGKYAVEIKEEITPAQREAIKNKLRQVKNKP